MSRLLLHLGRFAARRPVVTIVGWIALAAIIIGSLGGYPILFVCAIVFVILGAITVPGWGRMLCI